MYACMYVYYMWCYLLNSFDVFTIAFEDNQKYQPKITANERKINRMYICVFVCVCVRCSIGFQYTARALFKNAALHLSPLFRMSFWLLDFYSICFSYRSVALLLIMLCSIVCIRSDRCRFNVALPLLVLLSSYGGDDNEPTKTAAVAVATATTMMMTTTIANSEMRICVC